jgi:hypothetical protein
MSYRKFYIEDEIVRNVITYLHELQSLKRERLENNWDDDVTNVERDHLKSISYVFSKLKWAIEYSETEQDENEELAAVDKLMKEISKEAGYSYATKNRTRAMRNYFESIQQDKHEAYKVFAALVDDMRIKLLAVQFLINGVLVSATHRVKDTKLGMVQETLDALIEDLGKTNKDRPQDYFWRHESLGSWDYAKALTKLHHKSSNIDRLEKENALQRDVQGQLVKSLTNLLDWCKDYATDYDISGKDGDPPDELLKARAAIATAASISGAIDNA